MKLIIDLPEEEYKKIWLMSKDGIGMALYDWVANGTPLEDELNKIIRDIDDLKCLTMEADFRDRVFKIIEENISELKGE